MPGLSGGHQVMKYHGPNIAKFDFKSKLNHLALHPSNHYTLLKANDFFVEQHVFLLLAMTTATGQSSFSNTWIYVVPLCLEASIRYLFLEHPYSVRPAKS